MNTRLSLTASASKTTSPGSDDRSAVGHIVTHFAQCTDRLRHDIRIGQDAHLLRRNDETFFGCKLAEPRGIEKACVNVIGLRTG
jgi:hypothetical protein